MKDTAKQPVSFRCKPRGHRITTAISIGQQPKPAEPRQSRLVMKARSYESLREVKEKESEVRKATDGSTESQSDKENRGDQGNNQSTEPTDAIEFPVDETTESSEALDDNTESNEVHLRNKSLNACFLFDLERDTFR